MIYQFGHTHLGATVLANTLLERAATAATTTASRKKGQKLLARQTSNQRHLETLLVHEVVSWKPMETKEIARESGHKKGRSFPRLDCQKSRTFAAIEDYTCN